jgi:glycosyltransferase involved in cell wall biosynthesis
MGIKIGYDAKRYFNNPTGLGNYSRTLINYLSIHAAENQYSLFVHRKFYPAGFNKFRVIQGKGHPALWRSRGIRKDIETSDIDIFHGLSSELPSKAKRNVKYVVTVHDVIFKIYPEWYNGIDRIFYAEKLRQALEKADSIIAISHQTANDLKEYYSFDESKLQVIYQSWSNLYNTLNVEEIHVPLLPKDYLLFVGSFYERKNLPNVIWALSNPQCIDIPLVVVGNGSRRYRQMIMELIEELKLERQVLILENVYDELLKQLYLRAKAVIYPSLYEGFGLPVLEALKCGVPVITSNNSSLIEIGDKACHIIENPLDREEISHSISTIWHDSAYYNRLKNEIPEHISQFSPENTTRKVAELYKSLV